MNKLLKLSIFAIMALVAFTVKADDDTKLITFDALPAQAQKFVNAHFAKQKVEYTTVEDGIFSKEYTVVLADKTKVEFNKDGQWASVEARSGKEVPAGVVPQQIRSYINSKFVDAKVRSIERDRRGYEVELDNGLELTFDSKFSFLKLDD